jgi:hypothetical protein
MGTISTDRALLLEAFLFGVSPSTLNYLLEHHNVCLVNFTRKTLSMTIHRFGADIADTQSRWLGSALAEFCADTRDCLAVPNCCNQAFAQACAVCSPETGVNECNGHFSPAIRSAPVQN